MVVLYSTGCPKCTVLKKKLQAKNIEFTEINDVDTMLKMGLDEVPVLKVDNKIMPFKKAVEWVEEV
jgi:glutaredoxin